MQILNAVIRHKIYLLIISNQSELFPHNGFWTIQLEVFATISPKWIIFSSSSSWGSAIQLLYDEQMWHKIEIAKSYSLQSVLRISNPLSMATKFRW